VEKRSWVEQVAGIISIISMLLEKYKSILIIIDGRTSPLTKTESGQTIIDRENSIFREISEALPQVDFINLVGRTMSEKIYFSSFVDLFFTSFATDSLYVSCIHGKNG